MKDAVREVIRLDSIVKDFRPGFGLRRKRVLHGVSFAVQEGEIFGFVGPNGSGKTTTLKVLMGLIRASSGSATLLGHDILLPLSRRHVGFLPENPYPYTFLTAREILDFYARLSGVGTRDRRDRIDALLARVGLEDAADARLSTYSKGMLQRAGVAQALVHDPSVVLMDEPMSGLDPIGRKDIRDIILGLKAEGKTVLMNTHILTDVEMICDRVAIIVEGHIRYEGAIRDFLPSDELRSDIVFSRVPDGFAESLRGRFSARVRAVGDQVEIHVKEEYVRPLVKLALEAGAELHSLSQSSVSLERIFLDAVAADEPGGQEDLAGRERPS